MASGACCARGPRDGANPRCERPAARHCCSGTYCWCESCESVFRATHSPKQGLLRQGTTGSRCPDSRLDARVRERERVNPSMQPLYHSVFLSLCAQHQPSVRLTRYGYNSPTCASLSLSPGRLTTAPGTFFSQAPRWVILGESNKGGRRGGRETTVPPSVSL